MTNVTLAFDESILKRAKLRARQQGTSFNAYMRELIERDTAPQKEWLQEAFALADEIGATSSSKRWSRDELYR